MATFDLSVTENFFSFGQTGLANHSSQALNSGGFYIWNTTLGQVRVRSFADDITATPGNAPTAGTVNLISVYNGAALLFNVTGIAIPIADLVASEEQFWRAVLAGSTTITGNSNYSSLIAGDFLTISGSENLIGADDVIDRNRSFDNIHGDALEVIGGATLTGGDDLITAGGFYVRVSGDAGQVNGTVVGGDDTITINNGTDTQGSGIAGDVHDLDGGMVTGGDDKIVFIGLQGPLYVDYVAGDVGGADAGTTVNGGNDTISGTSNGIDGTYLGGDVYNVNGATVDGGNDQITGTAENDNLAGDIVFFTSGSLTGGNDKISGGLGRDTMQGNAGYDDFDFNSVAESGVGPSFRDTIIGFQHNVDDIDLSTIDARAGTAGNNAFAFIGGAAFSEEGQIRVRQAGGDTYVDVNTTGTSGAEMTIKIEGLVTITAADFIL